MSINRAHKTNSVLYRNLFYYTPFMIIGAYLAHVGLSAACFYKPWGNYARGRVCLLLLEPLDNWEVLITNIYRTF